MKIQKKIKKNRKISSLHKNTRICRKSKQTHWNKYLFILVCRNTIWHERVCCGHGVFKRTCNHRRATGSCCFKWRATDFHNYKWIKGTGSTLSWYTVPKFKWIDHRLCKVNQVCFSIFLLIDCTWFFAILIICIVYDYMQWVLMTYMYFVCAGLKIYFFICASRRSLQSHKEWLDQSN